MPGRLLSFVRAAPSSSTPVQDNTHNTPTNPLPSLLPPVYSYDNRSSNKRNHSQDSLVMQAFKRHSFGVGHHADKKSPKTEPHKGAKIDMVVESPPILFHSSPATSSGALFSGQLKVYVTEPQITLKVFTVQLLVTLSTKKPVVPHCHDCAVQTTEIQRWDFLSAPTTLRYGTHEFPFSHLLQGHLPATTQGNLAAINYYLQAIATTDKGDKITFKRDVDIKRAILPGNEKNSTRLFPPTNITIRATLPSVFFPIGQETVSMRLSGLVTNKKDFQARWRLCKLNWRIEEVHTFVSPACAKHAKKVGGEGKGVQHEDTRIVGYDELKTGWKTDFTQDNIEVEFPVVPNIALHPVCNMESPNGMEVTHTLIAELVMSEEWAPLKKLDQATPTGAARVLRTQFVLVLTERAGLGIAWDEENPPVYEDVPASPPSYATALTTVSECNLRDYDVDQLDSETSSLDLSN